MSDVQSIDQKLDTVIAKITKSKKYSSVRILEEVKRDLQELDQTSAPVVRQTIVPAGKPDAEGTHPYVEQNGEVAEAVSYLSTGQNLLLTGGTGCGKTHLAEHLANLLGKQIGEIQGNDGCTIDDIIGYRDLRGGDTTYTYGVLPVTMKLDNGMIYWDEPNMTAAGIQSVCWSAMDHRRRIVLPQNGGEVIKAREGFVFIGAMNEGRW